MLAAGAPRISTLHQPLKTWIFQESVQPGVQRLELGICIKSLWIRDAPLANEGPERHIGKAAAIPLKPAVAGNAGGPAVKNHKPCLLVLLSALPWIAIGVLEPIQMVFQRSIVFANQGIGVGAET